MERYYSAHEVAQRYSITSKTVLRLINEGKLGAIKVGKTYRIRESDLAEFEKSAQTKPEERK